MNQEQKQEKINSRYLSFSKKKDAILIAVIAVCALGSFAFAMTVDNFSDYNPPDHLYINWADYMTSSSGGIPSPSSNNPVTSYPRWSVTHPYRAIFLGGQVDGDPIEYYIVYSKQPSTDLFQFSYVSSKSGSKLGRIRATLPANKVGIGGVGEDYGEYRDFIIVKLGHTEKVYGDASYAAQVNFLAATSNTGTDGDRKYFYFDFYYDCASEHQRNAYDLNISNVTSINVPYNYITHCLDHVGSSGGVDNGGGGSSSGGSGGGGSFDGKGGDYLPWPNNKPPKYGSSSQNPAIPPELDIDNYDIPKYSDFPSPEKNPPEWSPKPIRPKGNNPNPYPWEDDSNIPKLDWTIDIPPFTNIGDGDTGAPIEFPKAPPSKMNEFQINIPDLPVTLPPPSIYFPLSPWFTDGWPPTMK